MCMRVHFEYSLLFFFNDPATTEIYTLSLHDALPISSARTRAAVPSSSTAGGSPAAPRTRTRAGWAGCSRSEEHTSELQSQFHLVCRLLLEKKKNNTNHPHTNTYVFNITVKSTTTTHQ